MDAVFEVRAAFLLAAVATLFVSSQEALRTRFLQYGSRTSQQSNRPATSQRPPQPSSSGTVVSLLDYIATYKVPHGWFIHFYVASTLCAAFWAQQIATQGFAFRIIAECVNLPKERAMSTEQVVLLWLLMFFQSGRRLLECVAFSKPSQSQMWIGHWLLGLAFYVGINVAIWIEGSPTLPVNPLSGDTIRRVPSLAASRLFPMLLFGFASYIQLSAHKHLAELPPAPNYTLPTHRVFGWTLTPHYLAECLVYLAMAIIAAPQGSSLNWTVASAAVFVGTNLGLTAWETRKWYARRFGEDRIKAKAAFIPYVF